MSSCHQRWRKFNVVRSKDAIGWNTSKFRLRYNFIGDRAFNECSSLSHMRLSSPVCLEPMTDWPFKRCSNFISVELPEGFLIAI
eukprot:scaffold12689_cov51-Cylindrotheca_fusiformis.AAC.2